MKLGKKSKDADSFVDKLLSEGESKRERERESITPPTFIN